MKNNIKILDNIELEFAKQDTRWQFRAKLSWKILFREINQKEYDKKIKQINNFFNSGNCVIENETNLPYKVIENKKLEIHIDFILNKIFTGKKQYFINSKYLQSPIKKAKYTPKSYELSKSEFEQIKLNNNEQLKINFLENLENISNFLFTQDWYFLEIVLAYKILLSKITNNKIQITKTKKIIIEDWSHRIIALVQLIKEWKKMSPYNLYNLKDKIKQFLVDTVIIESKLLKWHFIFEQMQILNYNKIDEQPNEKRMREIINNYR